MSSSKILKLLPVLMSGGGWTPKDVSGLKLWLKADSISGADADPVTTWIDSSLNNHNATEATAPPILKQSIVNGRPVVRFNGTDQYMSITSHADFALAAPWHVFVVLSTDYTTAAQYKWWMSKASAWQIYSLGARAGYANTAVADLPALYNYFEIAIFMLLELVFDSSNDMAYFINGWQKEIIAGASNPNTNTNAVLLGRNSTTYWDGDIAEILLYSGALAAADKTLIRNYLANKYGLYISVHDIDWAVAARAAAPLTTPTHDGHGNTVQPDVVYVDAGWNGYKYWMMCTSYPADDHTEALELLTSNDGDTWDVPAGGTNPITGEPPVNHQWGDPCLFFSPDGLTLNCVYYDLWTGNPDRLWLTTSTDGITWTTPVLILTSDGTEIFRSPSIVWDGANYILWTCNTQPAPDVFNRRTCPTITGSWSAPTACIFKVSYGTTQATKPPITFPFHGHVKYANGIYYGFYADISSGLACLISSADGITWQYPRHGPGFPGFTMGTGGAVWDKTIYSCSILKLVSGFDLFYSAMDAGGTIFNIGRTTITGIV